MFSLLQRTLTFLTLLFVSVPGQTQGIVDVAPQIPEGVNLGIFRNGWASISEGSESYYINTLGEKIRTGSTDGTPLGDVYAIEEYERQLEKYPNALPAKAIIFEQNGLWGVISPIGEVLLTAKYDHIDTEYQQFWKLFKHNQKALYLPDGSTTAFFDDIGYLDGVYFDVKRGDDWHIYHHPSGRVISKTAYEGFDYCGGCGSAAPYVYAKKNGKWGVIDWEEKVLVPFEYDHEHRRMRNDNWIASFSKDGQSVIVHIPTQQVFDGNSALVSGMLITSDDGRYGAFDRDGELAIPFEYDRIEAPNQNDYRGYFGQYLIVEKGRLKGVVRSDGEVVVPVEYELIMVYDDYFVVTRDGLTSLLSVGSGEPLVQLEHGEITHINDYFYSSGSSGLSVFKIKQQAFYGLYFAESGVFIEPGFYDIYIDRQDYFVDSLVIVGDRQGMKTLFSTKGKSVLPFSVEEFQVFSSKGEQFLSVKERGKWGLYDIYRQVEILPAKHNSYFTVLDNTTSVLIRATIEEQGQPDRYTLYNMLGEQVINRLFDRIETIDSIHYLVQMEDDEQVDYAVFDVETYTLEYVMYDFVCTVGSPKLLLVSDNKRVGKLYDIATAKELERNYNIRVFSGEIDDEGGYFSDVPEAWTLLYFSDGLAEVRSPEGAVGLIDEREQVVIAPQYAGIRVVDAEYTIVTEIDEYTRTINSYYANRQGERIFPEGYGVDDMLIHNFDVDMNNTVVLQQKNHAPFFVLGNLETGKIQAEAVYNKIVPLRNFPYLITAQYVENESRVYGAVMKYGLAGMDGTVLFEPIFDDILFDESSFSGPREGRPQSDIFPLLVRQDDRWKYVNADGSYLSIVGTGTQ